jgi:uncharacterized membrane protein
MSRSDASGVTQVAASETEAVRRDLKQILLSGVVLTVPFFATLLVLVWAIGWLTGALQPLAGLLNALGFTQGLSDALTNLAALGLVVGIVVAVGVAAQHGPDTHVAQRVDLLMEDIPGVGSIYQSIEEMSEVLVAGDTESFREVKLVEFPTEGSFALAFTTAETPSEFEEAVDRSDMLTVFVPMAPNPVMGGHLISLSQDRVYDVDLSVEEGMEAIITTGVTIDESNLDHGE